MGKLLSNATMPAAQRGARSWAQPSVHWLLIYGVLPALNLLSAERGASFAEEVTGAKTRMVDLGEIKSTTIDLGAFGSSTSKVKVRFRQRNPYGKVVHIDAVRVNCSCFSAASVGRTISANGSLEFLLTLNLTNEATLDEASFAVTFEEGEKAILYRLKYRRPTPPKATPSSIDFGSGAKVGDTRRFCVRVASDVPGAQIDISPKISCTDQRLDCELVEETRRVRGEQTPMTEFVAIIETSVNKSAGSSRKPISAVVLVPFRINGEDIPLKVSVHGAIEQPVEPRPSTLLVVIGDSQSSKTRSATIALHGSERGPSFDDIDVSCDDPRVKMTLQKADALGRFHVLGKVLVTVDVSDRSSFDANVTFRDRVNNKIGVVTVPVKVRAVSAAGSSGE
jgi:hypothetical protein